jgi:hypothetical protein
MSATTMQPRRRVRVWFGEHAIADYTAEPALAECYAAAMGRRFTGLRITLVVAPPLQAPAPDGDGVVAGVDSP